MVHFFVWIVLTEQLIGVILSQPPPQWEHDEEPEQNLRQRMSFDYDDFYRPAMTKRAFSSPVTVRPEEPVITFEKPEISESRKIPDIRPFMLSQSTDSIPGMDGPSTLVPMGDNRSNGRQLRPPNLGQNGNDGRQIVLDEMQPSADSRQTQENRDDSNNNNDSPSMRLPFRPLDDRRKRPNFGPTVQSRPEMFAPPQFRQQISPSSAGGADTDSQRQIIQNQPDDESQEPSVRQQQRRPQQSPPQEEQQREQHREPQREMPREQQQEQPPQNMEQMGYHLQRHRLPPVPMAFSPASVPLAYVPNSAPPRFAMSNMFNPAQDSEQKPPTEDHERPPEPNQEIWSPAGDPVPQQPPQRLQYGNEFPPPRRFPVARRPPPDFRPRQSSVYGNSPKSREEQPQRGGHKALHLLEPVQPASDFDRRFPMAHVQEQQQTQQIMVNQRGPRQPPRKQKLRAPSNAEQIYEPGYGPVSNLRRSLYDTSKLSGSSHGEEKKKDVAEANPDNAEPEPGYGPPAQNDLTDTDARNKRSYSLKSGNPNWIT